ncbi:unnamed protein product [Adineta steineri]|uniref:Uncharacterized protein n=1 Tax=Adineta steineri TaxID=433720 RepID=A0A815JRR0_9BILA|nr:unnamed protein product [Adineta steineri]CAF4287759.1 unnamed protein product [Adineta steineri]
MLTIGIYLLNLFKHPIISWLGTILHFIINNIGEIKTIDQCRILHTFTADCFPLKINTELDLTSSLITSVLINKISTYRLIDYMYTTLNKHDVFGLNSSIKNTFYEIVKTWRRKTNIKY